MVFEILRVAWRAMSANRVRTLLTMLGIVVGVGSVIVLIAFSEGQKKELLQRFEAMGAKRMGAGLGRWRGMGTNVPNSVTLSYEDAEAIRESVPTVEQVAVGANESLDVRYGNTTLSGTTVLATEPNSFVINNDQFEYGAPFSSQDNMLMERVCVLAYNTKYSLFFEADPVGQYISIDGKRFRVVGSLTEKGGSRWMRLDDRVIIPYNTGSIRMPGKFKDIELAMTVTDTKYAEIAAKQVRELLRARNPRIPQPRGETEQERERNDPLYVWNIAEMAKEREATADSMQKFLVVMGALSLLIGGVGVMNIMLVTVQERTREIGLRKAVGATGGNIMAQFMTEAVVICVSGGTIGTLGAMIACKYMERLPDEARIPDPVLTPEAIAVAVVVTLAVGLFFGIYPATRAAGLNPIQALRYE
jgi:putative ABC transport system permease protein